MQATQLLVLGRVPHLGQMSSLSASQRRQAKTLYMASVASGERQSYQTPRGKVVQTALKAAELLVLAAIYSPVSQLTLSPVYGSIPASIHHQRLMIAAGLVAWIGKPALKKHLPTNTADLIPVLAFSIPTIQFFLFQQSSRLGATYGPLVTEAFTYFPLVFLSVFCAASLLDSLNLGQFSEPVLNACPGVASYAIFSGAQKISTYAFKRRIGSSLIFTRSGLQLVLATFYALLLPSRLTLLAIIPLLHSASFNVHVPFERTTALLNRTLHANDYILIARQESLTGYISVLDNTKDGFRVMRCDHSLLGGEWLQQPKATGAGLREPIYAVFAMLEAVRLVQLADQKQGPTIPDSQKNALVMYARL